MLLALLLASGCSFGGKSTGALPPQAFDDARSSTVSPGKYIKHVVIIVQENRSFDNIFEGFPGADTATFGCGRKSAKQTSDASGSCPAGSTKIPLHATTFKTPDIKHGWRDGVRDYDDGRMDGFNGSLVGGVSGNPTFPYAYVERSEVKPYWDMARQYVLADRMFPTGLGESFVAHFDLIAGTSNLKQKLSIADPISAPPWTCTAPPGSTVATVGPSRVESTNGVFPCFNQFGTLADTLDAKKISWKYYAPPLSNPAGKVWSEFSSLRKICEPQGGVCTGPVWKAHVVSPETTVLTDAKDALPSVAWVIPDLANSDHAGEGSSAGPSWVASVVNAIGTSKYWKSTAIVVLWDDWGGWYDHVKPPQLDFRGLGIRVPCIIISPYVKPHVSHEQYEFGSILKFVEQTFDLPPLASLGYGFGYTDERAQSLVTDFDFTGAPRAFKRIPAALPAAHFLHERPSFEPPDD